MPAAPRHGPARADLAMLLVALIWGGNLPVIEGAAEAIPELGQLIDADAILNQNAFAERRYPWASSEPRWALQTAIEAALAGTMTPKQALQQAQKETEDWLQQQQADQESQ